LQEQKVPEGYSEPIEQKGLKGKLQMKESCVRVEMTVKASSGKVAIQAAMLENYEAWLNSEQLKCLSNKQTDTHKSSSEIYCMTLQTSQGKFDFLYRRFVQN